MLRGAVGLCRCANSPLLAPRAVSVVLKNHVEGTGRTFIATRNYCEVPTMIPQVNEDEISDKVRDIADRMLKLDFISLCQFMDLLKERTGIDPNALGDMGAGAAAAGAGPAKAAEVADTGFRKVVIREFTAGNLPVKEKFSIMKLMRAEQPDLSLADVCFIFYCSAFTN